MKRKGNKIEEKLSVHDPERGYVLAARQVSQSLVERGLAKILYYHFHSSLVK
jgi:hypothetical protein